MSSRTKRKISPPASYAEEDDYDDDDDGDYFLSKKVSASPKSKSLKSKPSLFSSPSSPPSTSKHKSAHRSRLCSVQGCTKQVQQGGVCCRHGAKTTRATCRHPGGCTNVAKRGGLCRRHGAFELETCKWSGGCKRVAKWGEFCDVHTTKKNGVMCALTTAGLEVGIGNGSKAKKKVGARGGGANATPSKKSKANKAKSPKTKEGGGVRAVAKKKKLFIPPLPSLPPPTPMISKDARKKKHHDLSFPQLPPPMSSFSAFPLAAEVTASCVMSGFPDPAINKAGLCKQVSSDTASFSHSEGSCSLDSESPTKVEHTEHTLLCNHQGCQNKAVFDGICVTHGAMRRIYAHNNNGGEACDNSGSNNNKNGNNELKVGTGNTMAEGGTGVADIEKMDFLCDYYEDMYDPFT